MLSIFSSSLSLNAVRFGAHATASPLGRGISAQHQRALLTMAVTDEQATRAWLGKQDAVPAVQSVAPMSVEEARAVLNMACDKGLVEACDALTFEEEQAKQAWLAQQDEGVAAVWGAPAAAPPAGMPVDEAPAVAATPLQPTPVVAVTPAEEEEVQTGDAKRDWMSAEATLAPPARVSPPARVVGSGPDTAAMEEAKAAWLAKQEVSSWGPKAAVLAEECQDGVETACEALSREEEAKAAWLANQAAPAAWGHTVEAALAPAPEVVVAPAAASTVDTLSACEELSSEEEAKAAWLANQEKPTWGGKAEAATAAAAVVTPAAAEEEKAEDAAKVAWLANQLELPEGFAEAAVEEAKLASAAAKRAWRAKQGVSEAKQEEAKAAWLANQEKPTWGNAAAVVAPTPAAVAPTPAAVALTPAVVVAPAAASAATPVASEEAPSHP